MFKVCPSCGGEYQLRASECPECHVPLSLGSAGALPPPPPASAPALPPAEELAPLQVETPWYLHELAEELQRHGISSRIDSHPPGEPISGASRRRGTPRGSGTQLAIYVPHEDLEAAREVAHAFALARLPDVEAADAAGDASACPACGEPIAENAASCPECGLEFPELESGS